MPFGAEEALAACLDPGELRMRAPNKFIAEDLAIRNPSKEVSYPGPILPAVAFRSIHEGGVGLMAPSLDDRRAVTVVPFPIGKDFFFLPDTRFQRPFGSVRVAFHDQRVYQSPHSYVCAMLVTNLITEQLNEHTYDADTARLRFNLSVSRQGFTLALRGFNDKLPILLETVLAACKNPSLLRDAATFSRLHERQVRSLRNLSEEPPRALRILSLQTSAGSLP